MKTYESAETSTLSRRAMIFLALAVITISGGSTATPAEEAAPFGVAQPHVIDVDLAQTIHNTSATANDAQHLALAASPLAAKGGGKSLGLPVVFSGAPFTGALPADTTGDVGGGRYVQVVSGRSSSVMTVLDVATGAVIGGPVALSSLWPASGACAEGWGEPGVAFDRLADRWVLSERGAGNHLCVYVSQSGDPVSGGWNGYDIPTTGFPDFPRLAAWPDTFVVTVNEASPALYALERTAMLAGEPASWQRFEVSPLPAFGFQSLTPAQPSWIAAPPAGARAIIGRAVDGQAHGGQDRLELWELDVNWDVPAASSLIGPAVVATTAFDSDLCGLGPEPCIPQPGTQQRLNPLREVFSSLVFTAYEGHQALAGTLTIDADGSDRAAVRFFELRRTGGSWSVHQEGTSAADPAHRWLGAATLDRVGNLALICNVSDGVTLSPSVRLTGRHADDPPGSLSIGEIVLQEGDGAQTLGLSPEEWGGWTSLTIDPGDGCTFWATAPYATGGAWGSVIATFAFDDCRETASDLVFTDDFESGTTGAWSVVQEE